MNFEQYKAIRAINASGLKLIARSPLHYWHKYLNPDRPPEKPSSALNIGSALHSLVLEDEIIYHQAPNVNKRTKAGREEFTKFEAELPENAIVLSNDEIAKVQNMASCINADKLASGLLHATNWGERSAEKTVLWKMMDLDCKARLDLVYYDESINKIRIVDLKTCRDASEFGFEGAITEYKYHLQAAFYSKAAKYGIGNESTEIEFYFICVENTIPFAVAVYDLDERAIEQGWRECQDLLTEYATCLHFDSWPSYNRAKTTVPIIGIRKWAQDKYYDPSDFLI